MVTDSNHWLIVAWWRQYFFIAYQNLPSETIGVPSLARAIVPSVTARKAAGDLRRLRPVGQTSAGLLVVLAFRRLLAGGQKLCHQHNFRGVRSSENIGFLGDLPRSLRRGAVGKLRTTSTRSPVCPAGRSRWRSPAAFRPGIHPPRHKISPQNIIARLEIL